VKAQLIERVVKTERKLGWSVECEACDWAREAWSVERRAAFSLVELMITLGLVSFIILGLLMMFQQVQRSFRSSMTQTDILESGRAVADQIARELEEMTPTQFPYPAGGYPAINFMAELSGQFAADPQRQFLPGASLERTNFVQQIFFMSRSNQTWIGTGYRVLPDYNGAGLGTLYRFSTNSAAVTGRQTPVGYVPPIYLSTNFLNAAGNPPAGFTQIADGIVHFRLRAFDTNGAPIMPASPGMPLVLRNYELGSQYAADQVRYFFYSNAVPAYLDLELGLLETHMVDRFKALADANPVAGRNYLSNHVANVHLFRRRIAIRNVEFSAYR
jgi:hypothetical protein